MHDAILTESKNFTKLGLSSVHASDELGYFGIPNTRIGRDNDGSNCLPPVHIIGEFITDRLSTTRSEQKYTPKIDFETRRENKYFGRQNNYVSGQ